MIYISQYTDLQFICIKKNLSFISKDISTQSDDAHVHPCERQG